MGNQQPLNGTAGGAGDDNRHHGHHQHHQQQQQPGRYPPGAAAYAGPGGPGSLNPNQQIYQAAAAGGMNNPGGAGAYNSPTRGGGGAGMHMGGNPGVSNPQNAAQAAAHAAAAQAQAQAQAAAAAAAQAQAVAAQQQAAAAAAAAEAAAAAAAAGYPSSSKREMARSGSDASMTILDGDQIPVGGTSNSNSERDTNALIENFLNDDTVPTVFRWEHGGRQVYITGTFNGWSRQIPMHRSGNDFTYIHNLKRGKHAFKFIVDDEWRFAPDQPTVADIEGRINNFIDVTDFKAYTGDREFEKEKAAAEYGLVPSENAADGQQSTTSGTSAATPTAGSSKASGTDVTSITDDNTTATGGGADGVPGDDLNASPGEKGKNKQVPDRDGEIFNNNMPDLDDYTKEPPPLPPHLRHIILNKPPQLQDTAALPVPQHVALNHLYCTAIKDNMMVLGITQRFKTKFVTTVYYSPCTTSK